MAWMGNSLALARLQSADLESNQLIETQWTDRQRKSVDLQSQCTDHEHRAIDRRCK
jgi:hypothetical protein